MRSLKVISTGSKGNCYLLDCDGQQLLIDAGAKMPEIKAALDYDISHLNGLITSHCHIDHSYSESKIQWGMAVPVLAPYHNPDKPFQSAVLGDYVVNAFPLPHNGTPNYGFLIRNDLWKMTYMTDFQYSKYSFKSQRLNCLLVECNYIDELVEDESVNFEHIIKGHASLAVTKSLVEANLTDALETVILCHLSHINSDEDRMLSEIKSVVPSTVNVYVAHKGDIFEL